MYDIISFDVLTAVVSTAKVVMSTDVVQYGVGRPGSFVGAYLHDALPSNHTPCRISSSSIEGKAGQTIRKKVWMPDMVKRAICSVPVAWIKTGDVLAPLKKLEAQEKMGKTIKPSERSTGRASKNRPNQAAMFGITYPFA